jgi:glycosyltransferase involved in cell wall biosynthesis
MTRPLISIITPCLNRAGFVREAVESVLAQNYPEFEHIVMDAGSTDGTLDILRLYPHLRLVSEPDKGMYDGINKGLRLAGGEIIGLLNTDDLYAPGCFEAVAAAFGQNPGALAVVGGTSTFIDGAEGRVTVTSYPAIGPEELWYRVIRGHPVTNAWFFSRDIFSRAGDFDSRFRFAADRFFLIHITLDCGVRPIAIPATLYHYRKHSGSATITDLDSRTPQYGIQRMKTLQEDIRGLEEFLDRPTLPGEIRRHLLRAHGECCYRLSATGLYHRQWRLAFQAIRHGWGRNALWPFIFSEMAVRRLRKEFTGHE